jgi:multisubunit Na+/H+ antiporter MnhC subunit
MISQQATQLCKQLWSTVVLTPIVIAATVTTLIYYNLLQYMTKVSYNAVQQVQAQNKLSATNLK